jgi:hypothetical protein
MNESMNTNFNPYTKTRLDLQGIISKSQESSSGKGDPGAYTYDSGGASYGAYQFASKKDIETAQTFVAWLYGSGDPSLLTPYPFPDGYPLTGDPKVGKGGEFYNNWMRITEAFQEKFLELQHRFAMEQYYWTPINQLRDHNIIDLSKMSFTLQNVIFSTSIQHDARNAGLVLLRDVVRTMSAKDADEAQRLIKEAAKVTDADIVNLLSTISEEELIDRIYLVRSTWEWSNCNNDMKAHLQEVSRYREREGPMAQAMLKREKLTPGFVSAVDPNLWSNFSTDELRCPVCNEKLSIHTDILNALQDIRIWVANGVNVSLGYVCKEHTEEEIKNAIKAKGLRVPSKVEQSHRAGMAADIYSPAGAALVMDAAKRITLLKEVYADGDLVHISLESSTSGVTIQKQEPTEQDLEKLISPFREKLAEFKKYIQQLIAEIPSAKELLDNIYNQVEEQIEKVIDEIKKLAKENRPEAEKLAKEKLTEVENLIKAMTDYTNGLLSTAQEKLDKIRENVTVKASDIQESATEKISELLWGPGAQAPPKEIDVTPDFNVASAGSNVSTTRDSTTLNFGSPDQPGINYNTENPWENLLENPAWLQFNPSFLLTDVVGKDPMDSTKFYVNVKGISYSGSHSYEQPQSDLDIVNSL